MNDESCCKKKQREIDVNGRERDRCVNPKAQVHLAIVNDTFCSMCPVRQACSSTPHKKVEQPTQNHAFEPKGYPWCSNRRHKEGEFVCDVTGLKVTPEICGRCDKETQDRVAKLPDKLKGYAGAIKRWVAAGRPTRSEEEQKYIREEHCLKCEMFDKEKDACKNCGCSLAMTGNPLTSKLAMKTEKCPLGRWE